MEIKEGHKYVCELCGADMRWVPIKFGRKSIGKNYFSTNFNCHNEFDLGNDE